MERGHASADGPWFEWGRGCRKRPAPELLCGRSLNRCCVGCFGRRAGGGVLQSGTPAASCCPGSEWRADGGVGADRGRWEAAERTVAVMGERVADADRDRRGRDQVGRVPGAAEGVGCVYARQPRMIYLQARLAHPRGVMLHELGHVYDLTVL